MSSVLVLVSAAVLGIEIGWEPMPEGGHEYTIQIEPNLLEVLQRGNAIVSEVPPQVHVRRYRVTVGSGTLPRVDGEAQPANQQPAHHPHGENERPKEKQEHNNSFSLPPVESGAHDASQKVKDATDRVFDEEKTVDLPQVPAKLPFTHSPERLGNQQAKFETKSDPHSAEKPSLKDVPSGTQDEEPRPWWAFFISAVLLCCSLGANIFLGWMAWDFRGKYLEALDSYRTA